MGFEGIAIDNGVNSEEANKLYQWMAKNSALKGTFASGAKLLSDTLQSLPSANYICPISA